MLTEVILLFDKWFKEASKNVTEAEAMNLATCNKSYIPSNRTVLLKKYDENGFIFYTNLESRKGKELIENPFASLCFYWKEIGKQIRIEGKVSIVSDKEADEYFKSRSLGSKIGASISQQSRIISEDVDLAKEIKTRLESSDYKEISRPHYWSGFCLTPNKIEFWKKGDYRIHVRIAYYLTDDNKWKKVRLYP